GTRQNVGAVQRRVAAPGPRASLFDPTGNSMATHQKVAVVTGAGTGIGQAAGAAWRLLRHTAVVLPVGGGGGEPLAEAIAQTGSLAANGLAVPTDVADP